jgi:hypothetical protein
MNSPPPDSYRDFAPLRISPLYFVKRGKSLSYNVLHLLFAEQKGVGDEFMFLSC